MNETMGGDSYEQIKPEKALIFFLMPLYTFD